MDKTPTPMSEDTNGNKQMKVHSESKRNRNLVNVPELIPYSLLNEDQARSNHGQSLDKLNSRGGIGVGEALDIIHRRRWTTTKDTQAGVDELNALIIAHTNELDTNTTQNNGEIKTPWHEALKKTQDDIYTPATFGTPTNDTTQSAEEFLIQAKDNVAKQNGYRLFAQETGGYTRFDKMWDANVYNGEKTRIMNEVAREYARLYHSEQLAQAKLPSEEEIEKFASEHLVTDENDTGSIWSCKKMGAEWFRSQVLPYITRIEQERQSALDVLGVQTVKFAELRAAMQEFIDRVDKGEVKSTRTYNKFKKLLHGTDNQTT